MNINVNSLNLGPHPFTSNIPLPSLGFGYSEMSNMVGSLLGFSPNTFTAVFPDNSFAFPNMLGQGDTSALPIYSYNGALGLPPLHSADFFPLNSFQPFLPQEAALANFFGGLNPYEGFPPFFTTNYNGFSPERYQAIPPFTALPSSEFLSDEALPAIDFPQAVSIPASPVAAEPGKLLALQEVFNSSVNWHEKQISRIDEPKAILLQGGFSDSVATRLATAHIVNDRKVSVQLLVEAGLSQEEAQVLASEF